MLLRGAIALLMSVMALPAFAQFSAPNVVVSDEPSSVSVTVYRDPNRSARNTMNLQWLNGYALITEQRTIDLPAGEVELRFEGVAGGIIPQSAIVTGLPEGVAEKNRDAALLSPSALLNGHLGKRVHLRRTNPVTGVVSENDAVIRTDARGGMVVQTEAGFEALRCTGLNETLVYREVPEGLSAKPTLSVRSTVSSPTRATVTLSYLATGFDWQANYVAKVDESGKNLNLFAWVTLANGDETSFVNANTQTVAGQPNKKRDRRQQTQGGAIRLKCWPQGTTDRVSRPPPPPAPPPPPSPVMMEMAAPITVTASRKMADFSAKQEDLGDLKLYRLPVPVTVASQSQKQVMMFEKGRVKFDRIHRATMNAGYAYEGMTQIIYRFQNRKRNGLGLPLPAGKMTIFKKHEGAEILVGEGGVTDRAIDEEVDVSVSASPLVRFNLEQLDSNENDKVRKMKLTLTNASSGNTKLEVQLSVSGGEKIAKASRKLGRKNGQPLWAVTVPANGTMVLEYQVKRDR